MVPVDSSAARMPRPGATMASATLFNSATFIALSRKKFTPDWSQILSATYDSLSPEGRGWGEGGGLLSKYSESVPPHPILLPSGEKGRSSPSFPQPAVTSVSIAGDSAACLTLFYALVAAEVSRTNSTSTPGSVLPSSDSRNAPPAVETWLSRPVTPATLSSATVSPPPAKLTSFLASVSSA